MTDDTDNVIPLRGRLSTSSRESRPSVRLWGLTGGIASGKSTAGRFFTEFGLPIIDADQIARELSSEGGKAYPLIVRRFGTADRPKLREIVFRDPAARRDLEGILHPLIATESFDRASRLSVPDAVYEATLLIEAGRVQSFPGLIVIEAPLDARIARLVARDRISEDLARSIVASQTTDEERRRHATWVVRNDASEITLRAKVAEVADAIKAGKIPKNVPELL